MKIACVLLPHLRVQIEWQKEPRYQGKPTLVFDARHNVIIEAFPDSIAAGTPLQAAVSRLGHPILVEAREADYQTAFDNLLDDLETVSPEVEPQAIGIAYVNLTGLESLYGGEEATLKRLTKAIPTGFTAHIGVGPGKFLAFLAAKTTPAGNWATVPQDTATFLRDMPADVLPISGENIRRLKDFGLRTLGQVASHPEGPLQAQFGKEGVSAWELAQGIDRSQLIPRRHQEIIEEKLAFVSPVVEHEALALAIETLLERALQRLSGRRARKALLTLGVYPGRGTVSKTVSFREPVADVRQALFVLKNVLERLQIPGPVEEVAIELSGLCGDAGIQGSLWSDVRQRENLRESLKQLEARLGERSPIYQIKELEPWSRLPERRRALTSFNP